MKHLVISEYGQFLSLRSERLLVKHEDREIAEYPLNRLHTVTIAKQGVGLSSNLVQACVDRGVRMFFLDSLGNCNASISSIRSNAVGATRRKQVLFIENVASASKLASRIVYGKIRNQRSIILYLLKYAQNTKAEHCCIFEEVSAKLSELSEAVQYLSAHEGDNRGKLFGLEGNAASLYWSGLSKSGMFPSSFKGREGRGALDITNAALNYGYAILLSRVWNAVLVAGLEPYIGIFHVERPGKPSLVLDLMEEYRAWCVDKVIIKNRHLLQKEQSLVPAVKKVIINGVQEAFSKSYHYKGSLIPLDSILQRQVYKLSGCFAGDKEYKPYIFKW